MLSGLRHPWNEEAEKISHSSETDESKTKQEKKGSAMQVKYLEIVSPDAEKLCDQYAKIMGAKFGEPVAMLGNARTAKIEGGGMIAIRKPMRDTETPVVRPYMEVPNLDKAVAAAKAAGAKMAIEGMEIPGHGKIAIYIQGGIECGLWQSQS